MVKEVVVVRDVVVAMAVVVVESAVVVVAVVVVAYDPSICISSTEMLLSEPPPELAEGLSLSKNAPEREYSLFLMTWIPAFARNDRKKGMTEKEKGMTPSFVIPAYERESSPFFLPM
ncbi:MAG: hypothetical protein H7844_00680 [Nitrospirae bacterium YQR-1]